jgi:hypothetical protein
MPRSPDIRLDVQGLKGQPLLVVGQVTQIDSVCPAPAFQFADPLLLLIASVLILSYQQQSTVF